jgi:cystathionine beta-lyase
LIWVETPTNPMMNIIDIVACSNRQKKTQAVIKITHLLPLSSTTLDLGADIVHSATLSIYSHSDVVMGSLVVNDKDLLLIGYILFKTRVVVPCKYKTAFGAKRN